MRTLTAAQTTLLSLGLRSHHVKVVVNGVSLTALNGYDWVESVTVSEHVDQPVGTATVRVRARMRNLTTNPLFTASLPYVAGAVLKPYKTVVISSATTGYGVEPQSADYIEIFNGRIFQVDIAGETITLECRDLGGDLMDRWIEAERPYGSTSGVAIQTVSQAILDADSAGVNLYSILSDGTPIFDTTVTGVQFNPSWSIKPQYFQQPGPMLEVLRNIWSAIGWDVRYRWSNVLGSFVLMAYKPIRSSPSVDYTISADLYTVNSLSFSAMDIRNAIEIRYKNGSGRTHVYTTSDATSITNYGRRWMRLDEIDSDLIDTSTEATILGDAILLDLKEPVAHLKITTPHLFAVQLNDYFTISADDVHLYSALSLAVRGITHNFADGGATTELELSGYPRSRALSFQGVRQKAREQRYVPPPSSASSNIQSNVSISKYGSGTRAK